MSFVVKIPRNACKRKRYGTLRVEDDTERNWDAFGKIAIDPVERSTAPRIHFFFTMLMSKLIHILHVGLLVKKKIMPREQERFHLL